MLSKNTLEDILNDWNYWKNPPKVGILRNILSTIPPPASDLVFAIQGVRRCGKSTLLAQLMKTWNLNPLECFFVNFEDPRLTDVLDHNLLDAIVTFAQDRIGTKKRLFFFFDEIQNIKNWEKWLHLKLERQNKHIFIITGSNASLLSGDFSTTLTGRHITIELFPFDFKEYLKSKPNENLESYLQDGGFPRPLTFKDPNRLLRQYFTDIIERDVRRHISIRSTLLLSHLVKAVFESMGSELSQRSLAKLLGVTPDTIGSHLDACEAAYILLQCPYFTFSEKQRSSRNRKYYPIDLGLRNAVITKGSLDLGKGLEAIVFHYLRKKNRTVFYWRGKKEVDFITLDGNKITPYQVSWDGIKERHHLALKEFKQAFPNTEEPICLTKKNITTFLKR